MAKRGGPSAAAALALLALLVWWALRPPRHPTPGQAPRRAEPAAPAGARAKAKASPAPAAIRPRLAICIDDWGYRREALAHLERLRFPLSTAVLPGLAWSRAAAEASFRAGHEVLLHCPMQPLGGAPQEKDSLLPGMDPAKVRSILEAGWAAVPHAVGLNNHEGSRATADRALMDQVAAFLKERGAFFLDSATGPRSQVGAAARAAGLPWAANRIFLDNVDKPEAVEARLDEALALARREGSCIAIGHPRRNTLEVLERRLAGAAPGDVALARVSELVHP